MYLNALILNSLPSVASFENLTDVGINPHILNTNIYDHIRVYVRKMSAQT
jgi:hypothetical protein